MEPNQAYKLLHSKGNHFFKKMKRQRREWGKNSCKGCNQRGLNLQNTREVE